MNLPRNKNLKTFARKLRREGTKGEAILWRDVLKNRQIWPYQFNRQFIIGEYIVDFVCRKLNLIIEIDGYSHFVKYEQDFIRQEYLKNCGYEILRFTEAQVLYRIDDVVAEIDYAIKCLEKEEYNPPAPFSKGDEENSKAWE